MGHGDWPAVHTGPSGGDCPGRDVSARQEGTAAGRRCPVGLLHLRRWGGSWSLVSAGRTRCCRWADTPSAGRRPDGVSTAPPQLSLQPVKRAEHRRPQPRGRTDPLGWAVTPPATAQGTDGSAGLGYNTAGHSPGDGRIRWAGL